LPSALLILLKEDAVTRTMVGKVKETTCKEGINEAGQVEQKRMGKERKEMDFQSEVSKTETEERN
jgi:nucleoside diphosphate kinase